MRNRWRGDGRALPGGGRLGARAPLTTDPSLSLAPHQQNTTINPGKQQPQHNSLKDAHAQVEQLRVGVDRRVGDALGDVPDLQQPHDAAHAHVAALRERALLLQLLGGQVAESDDRRRVALVILWRVIGGGVFAIGVGCMGRREYGWVCIQGWDVCTR